MKEYFARDYNINGKDDITVVLRDILANLRGETGEKRLIFDKDTYFLSSKNSTKLHLNITNTIGINEWEKGEEIREQYVPIFIDNIDNLTIDFRNSTLIIKGVVTNIVIQNSTNIKIENVEIKTENPNLHELKVINKTPFYIDYELDSESKYKKINNKYYFVGEDYQLPFKYKVAKTWWICDIKPDTPNKTKRTFHPLISTKIKEIAPYKFRAYGFSSAKFEIGERLYLYDVRRQNAGIFVDNSKDITLYNVAQRFNYSLAVVCQHTHNLTIDSVDFTPVGAKKIVSIADFIQICMCSGDVIVKNSKFEGAGDDCLNVHGFHFKIVQTDCNKLVVRFMHPQSYGFMPFDKGDKLAYIDRNSLIEKGNATVISCKMFNEYDIELEVDIVPNSSWMVENITKTPNLLFENNYLNRIITRGILITTRGKVEILNNVFNDNSMSGILISDDANNWYESGLVNDVLIKGNTFNNSEEYDILIKPENTKFEGYVHNNITITNNKFNSKIGGGIFVKDSGNVLIKDNEIDEKNLKIINKNSNIIK